MDHEFGRAGDTIYDSVIAKCKACGSTQGFQFPKDGFISEARSAMALRDYLKQGYGIDYANMIMSELQTRQQGAYDCFSHVPTVFSYILRKVQRTLSLISFSRLASP